MSRKFVPPRRACWLPAVCFWFCIVVMLRAVHEAQMWTFVLNAAGALAWADWWARLRHRTSA